MSASRPNLTGPTRADKIVRIHPVILCGGSGTRLWPLSRPDRPKQLISFTSPLSMLQETARLLADPVRFTAPTVVTAEDHRFIVAEQLRTLGIAPAAILLEPAARSTAPATTAAALIIADENPDALVLVMPSDLAIRDRDAFLGALDAAVPAALDGALVCLGAEIDQSETGYGIIHRGRNLKTGCHAVESFIEYPDPDYVARCIGSQEHFWNTGILLLPAARYLSELERLCPDTYTACRTAVARARRADEFLHLDPSFGLAQNDSVGAAVMERTPHAAVVPVAMGWSDLGSWDRLWQAGPKDQAGNVMVGPVTAQETRNCYLRSEAGLVAAIGLDDVIVVATPDVVMVAARDHAHKVKELVARLELNS